GVVGVSSSIDQVGLFGHTPDDIGIPLGIMCGKDSYDEMSVTCDEKNVTAYADRDFKKLKIAIPKQFCEYNNTDKEVRSVFESVKKWFKEKGAIIDVVDIPILKAANAICTIISLAEFASGLNRFDGIRYGTRIDKDEGYSALYKETRTAGFGATVKRSIVMGNYLLSEEFSNDSYKKAKRVRVLLEQEVAKIYKNYDIILSPTKPVLAADSSQKNKDEMNCFTSFANLSRTAAITIPAGTTKDGFSVGVQFAGSMYSEKKLLSLAQAWDKEHPNGGVPLQDETSVFSTALKEGN
ncbi:MAG TPA: amidase family protein, partial [Treponemataceae bacterium]|nr:amidase family protein [Treponemataceae bacterium]